MQLLALIPFLLLLLQPVPVLTTNPNNDNMETLEPPVSTLATTPDNNYLEKLKPPVSGLATTPNNDDMERLRPGAVRRKDTVPVRISLYDQGERDNEDPNLTCHERDEGDNSGGGSGSGNDASIQENRGQSKPKKRAVRAEWYTYHYRGMMYHIRINSSLGETYRNLATKAEQREFAMEHGEAEPGFTGPRVKAAR